MILRVSTVSFTGEGSIDCRLCHHRTVFPNDAQAIVIRLADHQHIRSAKDASVLHRCGLEYFWVCPNCRFEPDQAETARAAAMLFGSRGWRKDSIMRAYMTCGCGTEYVQRSRSVH